jgi:hypothetical protein
MLIIYLLQLTQYMLVTLIKWFCYVVKCIIQSII